MNIVYGRFQVWSTAESSITYYLLRKRVTCELRRPYRVLVPGQALALANSTVERDLPCSLFTMPRADAEAAYGDAMYDGFEVKA